MVIRQAEKGDIPVMQELLLQVGQVHHLLRPDIFCSGALKYTAAELEALLADKGRPIFVAEEQQVLGYCFCILRQYAGGAFTNRRELYIDDLCVDENHRGKGVATALYEYAVAYAKAMGCSFITLNVWQGNDSARSFYDKCGLRPRSTTLEMPLEENHAD